MLETLLIIRIAMVMVKVNFSKRCACVFVCVCVCKSVHGWKESVSFLSSDDSERDLVEIGGCVSFTLHTSLFFFHRQMCMLLKYILYIWKEIDKDLWRRETFWAFLSSILLLLTFPIRRCCRNSCYWWPNIIVVVFLLHFS